METHTATLIERATESSIVALSSKALVVCEHVNNVPCGQLHYDDIKQHVSMLLYLNECIAKLRASKLVQLK